MKARWHGLMGLALLVSVWGPGCGGDPCADLMARQCAAAGESLCEAMKEAAADAPDSEARRQLCASILGDEAKLNANLDALRAAAALKAVAGDAPAVGGQASDLGAPVTGPGEAPPASAPSAD